MNEKTKGIYREELLKICEHFLKLGDPASMEKRAVFLMLYHSVGRAGEAATTNFDVMHWDETHKLLWSGWNQTKTGRGAEISYTSDSSRFELDMFHALACYIVTAKSKLSPGYTRGPQGEASKSKVWLFPNFSSMEAGGCASKITHILEKLADEGVTTHSFTSHSLRIGATGVLAMMPDVPFCSIVARGDWYNNGECSVYIYVHGDMLVTVAGKCFVDLSGDLCVQ